jgi:hypothetical protein
MVRQFLRGDPEGPITRRRAGDNYEEDLLGMVRRSGGALP